MTDDPKAMRDPLTTFEVTLRIRKHTDARHVRDWFDRDHAYGPVERLNIHRDMHSSNIPFRADEGEYIDVLSVEREEADPE